MLTWLASSLVEGIVYIVALMKRGVQLPLSIIGTLVEMRGGTPGVVVIHCLSLYSL